MIVSFILEMYLGWFEIGDRDNVSMERKRGQIRHADAVSAARRDHLEHRRQAILDLYITEGYNWEKQLASFGLRVHRDRT